MRVAILAMGPSADTYARYAAGVGDVRNVYDEVWTVNAFGSIFRVDRVFHMDDLRIQQIRVDAGNDHIKGLMDYLQRAPGPIYTSRTLPKNPNPHFYTVEKALADLQGDGQALNGHGSERQYLEGVMRWMVAEEKLRRRGGFDGLVEYPLAPVLAATGGPPYFTSTVAYAFALALAGKKGGLPEDVELIAPFGVDYSHTHSIKAEVGRACVEFWIGRCIERGMKVQLPTETWLLGTSTKHKNLYGYDTQALDVAWDAEQNVTISVKMKPCPTAPEIERAYSHTSLPEHRTSPNG